MRRSRFVLAGVFACLVVAGCATPEQDVANRIRAAGSPIVRSVVYRPQNILDPAEVVIDLVQGTTQDQAQQLWCEVVAPAGGGDVRISLWIDGRFFPVTVDEICPAASP
jgi:hypothetical protein